ncbi:MAG: O-antigen ligase family protein [bacterium]|nr:O-antigen ligase family protein [bacterium]
MVESIYAFYLLSGISKAFIIFFLGETWAEQFNVTLLSAIVLVLLSLKECSWAAFSSSTFYRARGTRRSLIAISVFYLWLIFSLLYTQSPDYAYTKTFLFLTNMVAFVFPLTTKKFDGKKFMKTFVLMGTLFILAYMVLLPNSYAGYDEDLAISGKYLDISFLAALIVLVLLLLDLEFKVPLKITLVATNVIAVLIAGARGPLVFMVFVLLLRLLINPKIPLKLLVHFDLKKIVVIFLALLLLAGGLFYAIDKYADNMERSIARLEMVTDVQSGSLAVRFAQIYFSFETIFHKPGNFIIGTGVGSFGILYAGTDERLYPHNIIIETWFELGIIGVILLSIFLYLYVKKIKWNSNCFYVFLYLFLNSLKSSSLVDLRIMFGMMACLLLFGNYMENRRNSTLPTGTLNSEKNNMEPGA